MTAPRRIASRDNPLLVRLRKLAQDGAAYRRLGAVWLEGEHLCDAYRRRGGQAQRCVVAESAWADAAIRDLAAAASDVVLLPDALMRSVSALESEAGVGFEIALPPATVIEPGLDSVVLDRLQDPGNVGSLLRSAAALGVPQVVALKGTVALWSPKVLRAAMGAHFALRLVEAVGPEASASIEVPLVATSSHAGVPLPQARLPRPCAWVLGHEGQGVDPALLERCALTVRIPQPGGEESLNVAAAAAICFYAASISTPAGPA